MTKKVLFIDVDGTLVGFKDGDAFIPESAKNAIKQARKNGALAFLCTGRSDAEIYNYIKRIGFDGIIGAAGGYITYNNETLFHKRLPADRVKEITQYFLDHGVAFYLESNAGLYCDQHFMDYLHEHFNMEATGEDTFANLCQPLENANYDDINKISFNSATLKYDEIASKYGEEFYMVKASWGPGEKEAGEISTKGINKATAIHFLLNHLGLEDADTYGLGDSMNDLEMFECVKHAIAMGDSRHGVKDHAEFVTKDLLDDGIEFALQHYQLI